MHNKHKTHCPQGHRYSKANTAIYARIKNGHTSTFRMCKACVKARDKASYGTTAFGCACALLLSTQALMLWVAALAP